MRFGSFRLTAVHDDAFSRNLLSISGLRSVARLRNWMTLHAQKKHKEYGVAVIPISVFYDAPPEISA